ncbi:Non-catalytic module family DOC2 [Piromyces sp. E2]|nr:Non-catalytic module family DOC2 [Piromyces sp. E2]|eukprot:OUM66610.1 Non-catalytic module family DOC2 [Piromyces sp. E2]
MNNLSLLFIGLALINVPVCLSQSDKQCFSLPDYPYCKGNEVLYTDESGDWGVENGQWCGIIDIPSDTCFSTILGYPCCKSCEVLYTDEDGDWGVENGKWCGIKDKCTIDPVTNDFDFDFSFLKLENNKVNMLYSPLSIKYALTMLREGAEGNTYTEISKVLGNSELTKYDNIDKVLSLVNGLFVRNSFYNFVKPEFIDSLKEKYDTEIDELVQNPLNVMLLINALAIDMEWDSKFSYYGTYGRSFYLESGDEVKATTMSKSKQRNKGIFYYIDEDITVLTMNLKKYDEVQFEFMAIMPKENLSGYVEKVSKEDIDQIDEKLNSSYDHPYGVDITIPKFIFNYDLELKNDLKELGINDAFNNTKAEFSKIADSNELFGKVYVSEALHKANIEFTEDGIKAAAVTVFTMAAGASRPQPSYPIEIHIDKPFMFIIRDKSTKDIWFTGTVYEPNLWEDDKDLYTEKERNKGCISTKLGIPCCKTTTVVEYVDKYGEYGIENGDWCGNV